MTLLEPRSDARSPYDASPSWRQVEPGFWVGSVAGEFLGTIEAHEMRFFARNSTRAYVGEYTDVVAAQTAVQASARR